MAEGDALGAPAQRELRHPVYLGTIRLGFGRLAYEAKAGRTKFY